MGERKVGIGELILIAPIFHLSCASLFLIGYCYYIGNRISSFVTASDLFSVSVGDIGPLYFLTWAVPVIYLLWMRASTGAWTHAEAVQNAPEGPAREAAAARHRSNRRFYGAIAALFFLSQPIYMAISFFRWGYIPLVFVQSVTLMLFVASNVWLCNKLQIDSLRFHAIYLIGAMLITAGFSGLSRAQSDTRLSYLEALEAGPSCGEFAILRSVSDKLLAVSKSGSLVLVNHECKLIFALGREVAK